MSKATHRFQNQNEELPKDLVELANLVAALPQKQKSSLEPVLQRVVDSTRRRRRILQLVQEALSQLRLDMKYLVFDLEATRRERDALTSRTEDEGDLGDSADDSGDQS
jgi:hypothetical protein